MSAWPPVILGIKPETVEKILNRALQNAQDQGAPGADLARISVLPTTTVPAGQVACLVHISGVDLEVAAKLWTHHLLGAVTNPLKP